tara:strand:- start:454 stop:738 length:285 start_codon:yes stop_codon:yes gene_type:complete
MRSYSILATITLGLFSYFPSTINAHQLTKTSFHGCILGQVTEAARNQKLIFARDIERTCACVENQVKKGLRPNNCPTTRTVSERDALSIWYWGR